MGSVWDGGGYGKSRLDSRRSGRWLWVRGGFPIQAEIRCNGRSTLWVSPVAFISLVFYLLPPAYVVRREGTVFTGVCLSTGGGGGVRVTPSPGGYLTGYPPGGGTQLGQHREYLLHSGRYASCVHAGGTFLFFFNSAKLSLIIAPYSLRRKYTVLQLENH